MIRLIIAATVALTLSACGTTKTVVPTPVEMPALPAPLNQRAEPLPPLVATDLHGMIRESIATDRAYNEVRDRLNAVITAYECVRTAMLDGNDGRECFSR